MTTPDWLRVFPDADHRWVMGLRHGDAATFFAAHDTSGAVLAERARWLADDPHTYAALTPAAEPALAETIALAQSFGVTIDPADSPWTQLLAFGRAVEFDVSWLHADESGDHRLTGGVVCFPSSWALRDKLGKTMSETHAPVPGLNAMLDKRIEMFFAKMVPGVAWVRENANYSRVPALNQHPTQPRPALDASVTADDFWVRLEHQLLLKLPVSGSLLFAIRVETVPLSHLLQLPEAAARLARLLETMHADAAEYKSVIDARNAILPVLRAAAS